MKKQILQKVIRSFLIGFLFCFFANTSYSQTPNWEWSRSYRGGPLNSTTDVCVDSVGNSYTIGSYAGTFIFESTVDSLESPTTTSYFIAKHDKNGILQWAKKMTAAVKIRILNGKLLIMGSGSGSFFCGTQTISLSPNGLYVATLDLDGNILGIKSNVYSSGTFSGYIENMISYGSNSVNRYLFEFKPNATILLKTDFNSKSLSGAGYSAVDAANNYYMASTYGSAIKVGTKTLTYKGLGDIVLVKYNSAGTPQWDYEVSSYAAESPTCLTLHNSGLLMGIIFVDSTRIGTTAIVNKGNGNDSYLLKISSTGTLSFYNPIAIGTGSQVIRKIATDSDGNYIVAGEFTGDTKLGKTSSVTLAPTSQNVFVIKYDSLGNEKWIKTIGTSGITSSVKDITCDKFNNVLLSGYSSGKITGYTDVSYGGNDGFVIKLDANGNFKKSKVIGSATGSDDVVNGIASDSKGDYFVIGTFNDQTKIGDTTVVTGKATNPTAIVFNLDSALNLKWKKIVGETGRSEGRGIAVDANRGVYITGAYADHASFGTDAYYEPGNSNAFVAKLGNGCTVNGNLQPEFTLATSFSSCSNVQITPTRTTNLAPIIKYAWRTSTDTTTIGSTNSFLPSASGSYTFTATDMNYCSRTYPFTVTKLAAPTVNLGNDISINSGTSSTLDAGNAGATFKWSTGATSQTISVSTAGKYSVEVTGTNGCKATDTINVAVASNPDMYVFGTHVLDCGKLTNCDCSKKEIFVPLLALSDVPTGIIGMDYCMKYDPTYLQPTGNLRIGSVVTNNGLYTAGAQLNYNTSGEVRMSIYYTTLESATFSGKDTVASIGFTVLANAPSTTTVFSACELIESYEITTLNKPAKDGSLQIIAAVNSDTLAGKILYWNNTAKPLYSNSLNASPTVFTSVDSTYTTTKQEAISVKSDGTFKINLPNKAKFIIKRDIAKTTSPLGYLNGNDCYLTSHVTTLKSSVFTPSIYQILAMDVNRNKTVEAGDITLMQKRIIRSISEYPQVGQVANVPTTDWLFFDNSILANSEYKISATYPTDDKSGFSKYSVPTVPLWFTPTKTGTGNCARFTDGLYSAVLLGDVDGNWDNASLLKKGGSDNNIVLDLLSTVKENDVIKIPLVYSGTDNLTSFDFALDNFDRDAIEFVSIENGIIGAEDLDTAWNDSIRFTSYSLVLGGVETKGALYYIGFKSKAGTEITATQLGSGAAIINGIESPFVINGEKTAIQSIEKVTAPYIYPNPSKGVVNVLNTKNYTTLQVLDCTGKLIVTKNLSNNSSYDFDVTNIPSGIYFVKLVNGSNVRHLKLIKE